VFGGHGGDNVPKAGMEMVDVSAWVPDRDSDREVARPDEAAGFKNPADHAGAGHASRAPMPRDVHSKTNPKTVDELFENGMYE